MTPPAADDAAGSIDWSGGGRRESDPADRPPADAGESADADRVAEGGPIRQQNTVIYAEEGAQVVSTSSDEPRPSTDESATDESVGGPAEAEAVSEDAGSEFPIDAERLAAIAAERDEYLERLQRLQAEFENYRKRMTREQGEATQRGAQALANDLLPVLDGCEAALQQDLVDVAPINAQLVEILGKAGLERNGEPGDAFDPELHDAVMHEPADDGDDGSTIAEVLRTGYSWKGRVLRPAMVKVRG